MVVSTLVSMSLFALAASLSPGPVNLVGVSSGARYGIRVGLKFVTGATLGFIALFLLIGLGLQQLIKALPELMWYLKWAGVAFLLYISYQLWRDSGELPAEQQQNQPTPWLGALMQWLNPKAWLASISGIAAYTAPNDAQGIWLFAGLYLVICWLSLMVWVLLGAWMGEWLNTPKRIRLLNRTLAMGLIGSCAVIAY
ncbi:Cysteine/O-acetylserine efflux protein [Marinomonas aquimarina]|uniref:Cysteine/O-acetylserine efflux protein n=1 Tax=Marinomonas aquimarina TaxID=295068 RepID=A0A1A8TNE1_9GAMM|nr:LysE family translocator [Marinomonas aquimarina]SBS34724.1 Cysteine/O-acetylserine efflux protein [Marinomonas aquimarina]